MTGLFWGLKMKMTGNEKEKAPQEYYLWGLN